MYMESRCSFGSTNSVNDDLFCCGMTSLANGNILLCGGTLDYDHQTLNGKFHGGKYAYEVDFSSGSVATERKWHMVDGIQLALLCQMARSLLYRDGTNMDATIG